MSSPPSPEVVGKGLRKVLAAIEGSGFKAVGIGAMADHSWGSKRPVTGIELLLSTGEAQREAVRGAARGEGMQQAPDGVPMHFVYNDAKLNGSTDVWLVESSTPFHGKVIARAQPGVVAQAQLRVASCEDLILLRAVAGTPDDREAIIELLRSNAGRMDAAYVKSEAEAAGIFDRVKSAWQEAKQRG